MNVSRSDLNGQEDVDNKSGVVREDLIMNLDEMNDKGVNQIEPENQNLTKVFQGWLEILKTPAVGPFHAFTQGFYLGFEDILKIAEISTKLQGDVNEYLMQTNKASLDAISLVYDRSPKRQYKNKEDFEEFRKVVIDAFEECFTRLFESKEFAVLWNRLFINQSELVKLMQDTLVERNLKMLNVPTRDEFDSILKEVHDLKRIVHDIKNSVRST